MNRKINVIQTYFLLIMTNAITNHVIIIPLILREGQRDAWLSVIVSVLPSCLIALLILGVLQASGHQSLYDWLRIHMGRFIAVLTVSFFFLYLLSLNLISVKDTTTWVNVTFLPYTPPIVIGGLLVALCLAASYRGLWSITVCAGMLFPFVVLLGIFVSTANFQFKDYSLLTPILEHGLSPVWKGSLYATGGLFEIMFILLLPQHMSGRIRPWSFMIFTIITIGLMIGPLLGALANFGPFEAMRQRYPAYEQWRLVSFGKYISHLEFLSIYQWLSGSFIRISLLMFLLSDLLQFKRKPARLFFLIPLSAAMIIVLLLPVSDMQFVRILRDFYYPVSCALLSFVLIALFLFSRITILRNRRNFRHASDNE